MYQSDLLLFEVMYENGVRVRGKPIIRNFITFLRLYPIISRILPINRCNKRSSTKNSISCVIVSDPYIKCLQ